MICIGQKVKVKAKEELDLLWLRSLPHQEVVSIRLISKPIPLYKICVYTVDCRLCIRMCSVPKLCKWYLYSIEWCCPLYHSMLISSVICSWGTMFWAGKITQKSKLINNCNKHYVSEDSFQLPIWKKNFLLWIINKMSLWCGQRLFQVSFWGFNLGMWYFEEILLGPKNEKKWVVKHIECIDVLVECK